MPSYKITAEYTYEGIVEARSEDGAYTAFLNDLNSHYSSTDNMETQMVCPSCEQEILTEDDLNEDEQCEQCADQDNEEEA
jgi:hypothetical protein